MTSRDVSGAQKARAFENETRDAADRVDARVFFLCDDEN